MFEFIKNSLSYIVLNYNNCYRYIINKSNKNKDTELTKYNTFVIDRTKWGWYIDPESDPYTP